MTGETGPQRTLVVQPLPGIGDMVWHLPPLHAIAGAAADGKVSVLTKPRSLADRLLAADPAVDEILWLHRNPGEHDGPLGLLRLAGLLRNRGFGTVWILHPSARYALAAKMAGIPRRIGFGMGAQKWLVNEAATLTNADRHIHPFDKATKLVLACGVSIEEEEPRLVVAADAAERIGAAFGHLPQPWIALGIGSSEDYKQWGAENFITLAARLRESPGGTLFLAGGPDEEAMGRDIAEAVGSGGTVVNIIGRPIEETAALLARCRLYVGNDTGVLNISAAVGTDGIGLFGGSPPLGHSRRIYPVTPAESDAGMAGISVGQVVAVIQSVAGGSAQTCS